MSVSHKSSNTQIFRLMLYQRALHPELFELKGRRIFRHGEYEAEVWICPSAHVVRFQVNDSCFTETVIAEGDHLPEHGLLHALPCVGEKDYELESSSKVGYVTTVQTEMLTENLYRSTYQEMRDLATEDNGLLFEWEDGPDSKCLSMLDVQTYKREFHIQGYHMVASPSMILRTQSIFEFV